MWLTFTMANTITRGASGDRNTLTTIQQMARYNECIAELNTYLEEDETSKSEVRRLKLAAGAFMPLATKDEFNRILDHVKMGVVLPKSLKPAKVDAETGQPLGGSGKLALTEEQYAELKKEETAFDAWRASEEGQSFISKWLKLMTRKSSRPFFHKFAVRFKRSSDGKRHEVITDMQIGSSVAATAATAKVIGSDRLALEG